MSSETWNSVPLPEYSDLYEVSNLGNVRSLDRTIVNSLGITRRLKGLQLTPANNGSGYLFVGLSKGKVTKQVSVHRLVCAAFHENPGDLPNVNHKNGIKHDNRAENLEWCTRSHNIQHALNTGLKPRGININTNILTEDQVFDICRMLDTTNLKQRQIAEMFNVHKDTVGAINTGKNWNWLTNRKKV